MCMKFDIGLVIVVYIGLVYILVNWTCNCSLYNTLVLVVGVAGRSATRTLVAGRSATRTQFGTLVAGRSATRMLDGIRRNKQCSGRI